MDPLHVVAYGQEKVKEFRGEASRNEPWVLFAQTKKTANPKPFSFLSNLRQLMETTFPKQSKRARN